MSADAADKRPNVVAVVQARMPSTRLPDKVLADIAGRPMVWRVVDRVRQARQVDQVVVATSTQDPDRPIEAFCLKEGIDCHRGELKDVLDRYYRAAVRYGADAVVRVTADCPLIDPDVIDRAVDIFQQGDYDFVSNVETPTYPDGLDVEVFSSETLEKTWRDASWESEREHVTTHMKLPGRFRTLNFVNDVDLSHLRWTVDEPQDMEFVRAVYKRLDDQRFTMADVLALLEREPELSVINSGFDRNEGLQKSLTEDRLIDVER